MTKGWHHFLAITALVSLTLAGCAVHPEDRGYDSGTGYYGVYDHGPIEVDRYYYWHRHDGYAPHRHDRRGDRWDHRRNGNLYYGRPGEAPGHRQAGGGYWRKRPQADDGYRRDWRHGDGEFRRRDRQRSGVGLEERTRRDRQERINEGLNDRGDDAIRRRDQRAGRAPDDTSYRRNRATQSEFEARQQQRSTDAERAAQRRAAERRQQLLAERKAANQGTGTGQGQPQREGSSQADEQLRRQREREGIDPLLVPGTGAQTNR